MLLKICSILVVIFALTGCGNQQAAAVRQFPSGDRVVVNRVKEAVYNPDGSSILTSYAQQLAGVTNWNASSGEFVFNIEPGKALIFQSAFLDVQEMTFSEDGRFILTRSVIINIPSPQLPIIELWNAADGQKVLQVPLSQDFHSVALNHDASRLLMVGNDQVLVVDVATLRDNPVRAGATVTSAGGNGLLGTIAATSPDFFHNDWSPRYDIQIDFIENIIEECTYTNNSKIIRRRFDLTTTIVDLETGDEASRRTFDGLTPRQCPESIQSSTAFSTAENYYTSSPAPEPFEEWLSETVTDLPALFPEAPEPIIAFEGQNMRSAAFSPDGQQVLIVNDNSARVLDVASGETIFQIDNLARPTPAAWFSPDGSAVLTIAGAKAQMWDIETEQPRFELENFGNRYSHLQFVAGGRYIAAVVYTRQGTIYPGELWVWDRATGKQRGEFTGLVRNIFGLSFSPDGNFAVTIGLVESDDTDRAAFAQMWDTSALTKS
ncbi:MAG: WD40 repeat domain-containing protein [Anaerolineae bacterium]|nr:WD40 repeat domain-containing protein [Anaerolineae bacterium]